MKMPAARQVSEVHLRMRNRELDMEDHFFSTNRLAHVQRYVADGAMGSPGQPRAWPRRFQGAQRVFGCLFEGAYAPPNKVPIFATSSSGRNGFATSSKLYPRFLPSSIKECAVGTCPEIN